MPAFYWAIHFVVVASVDTTVPSWLQSALRCCPPLVFGSKIFLPRTKPCGAWVAGCGAGTLSERPLWISQWTGLFSSSSFLTCRKCRFFYLIEPKRTLETIADGNVIGLTMNSHRCGSCGFFKVKKSKSPLICCPQEWNNTSDVLVISCMICEWRLEARVDKNSPAGPVPRGAPSLSRCTFLPERWTVKTPWQKDALSFCHLDIYEYVRRGEKSISYTSLCPLDIWASYITPSLRLE